MYQSSHKGLFPWVTLLVGSVGFALRCWLLSGAEDGGLLPHNFIAGVLQLVLVVIFAAVCLLTLRNAPKKEQYSKLFPASKISAVTTVIGALGMAYTAFTVPMTGAVRILVPAVGIACAVCLCVTAYCRAKGLRPSCLLHCVAVVYLIFRTMASCRVWGSEPQLQMYLYDLLAALLLMIAGYYRTELDVTGKNYRGYVLFSQLAVLGCCLSLPGEDGLFYLFAGIWMAGEGCVIPVTEDLE